MPVKTRMVLSRSIMIERPALGFENQVLHIIYLINKVK
jgi:hypothetical protein